MGKKAVLVVLDQYADWEGAYISSMLLNDHVSIKSQVLWASIDLLPKKSMGGLTMIPDITLEQIPEDTDALILIGGKSYRKSETCNLTACVRKFINSNKVTGFICDATYYAAKEGFLNHVKHTGNSLSEIEQLAGYTNSENYINENAVSDKNIITANGTSPVEFAALVLKALNFLPEKEVDFMADMHLLGYVNALRKHGYIA